MAREKRKFQKERPPDPHAVGTDWRLFLAVPMPAAAQALLAEAVESLAKHDWPIRWISPESAHLTLHFLGATPPERAELLRLGLAATIRRHRSFALETGSPGVFPGPRHPRVLWIGLEGDTDRLLDLQRDLGTLLRHYEFEIEEREFHPHLTLGRVRDEPPRTLPAEITTAFAEPEFVRRLHDGRTAIPVEEVWLVRSYLERGGARHVPLGRYPLAAM